ncbi:MAG: hypothetical protein LBL48_06905 [Azoarcus sp.]|jgi:hypothetical protein|nr:hypothetical protein [Azoarcus sp.]MDR1228590.1 hypothetical protein [Azoarcus sp.]
MIEEAMAFAPPNISNILQIINMIGTFAIGIWIYLEKRNDKTNERITRLNEDVDKIDKELAALSGKIGGAVGHHDLSELYQRLAKVEQSVSKLCGSFNEANNTLRLILTKIAEKGLS